MKKQARLQFAFIINVGIFLLWVFFFGAISFGVHGQVQIDDTIEGKAAGDLPGFIVSLSADSSVLAIGAFSNNGNGQDSGHVRVYGKVVDAQSLNGFKWEQIGDDIENEVVGDLSGFSLSLSDDGSVLAIGASGTDGNGSGSSQVRVYKRDATFALGWRQLGGDIYGEVAGGESRSKVSLSSDGSVLAIGAFGNTENGNFTGQVRVYKKDATSPLGWRQVGGDIDGEAADELLAIF